MIKTLSPYSTTSKTAEIMSRYRPIAPKPDPPPLEGEPSKIRQSSFLRNIWPQLHARPTRTRKKGRTSTLAPTSFKRQRPHLLAFSSPGKTLSLHGFAQPQLLHGPSPSLAEAEAVSLPLLPIEVATPRIVPEEKDFLQQLQRPPTSIIAPQPIRQVGSVIRVERINSITTEELSPVPAGSAPKTRAEVEQEVESEALSVVISDAHNKVRIANSAYREMVGQPECSWLDGKRISGEVMLQLSDLDFKVPVSAIEFSCWVKIEWGNEGNKSFVNALCNAVRIACESKDYELAWRIRTQTKDAASPLSSTI